MHDIQSLRRELIELEIELKKVNDMSDDMLMETYNSNERDVLISEIKAEIDYKQSLIDKTIYFGKNDPDGEIEDRLFHFAFPTETAFWKYKGY